MNSTFIRILVLTAVLCRVSGTIDIIDSEAQPDVRASEDVNFVDAALVHLMNDHRRRHCVPDFHWDSRLANFARAHAASVCLTGALRSGGGKYGKHIWRMSSSGPFEYNVQHIGNVVNAWYNQKQDYNYDEPGYSNKTAHFTQVVWMDTTSAGCAHFSCHLKGLYDVVVGCHFYPEGNVLGEFTENVLKQCKERN
mmetsp:Transcript_6354/g.9644  ORF Transcript_6354/g.9644 Transcript_6354/m.9644 type:complete len:195 (-) Transcript_6354:41-625(-)